MKADLTVQRIRTHPGDILRHELEARGVSANQLALALGVPSGRIVEILNRSAESVPTPHSDLRAILVRPRNSG